MTSKQADAEMQPLQPQVAGLVRGTQAGDFETTPEAQAMSRDVDATILTQLMKEELDKVEDATEKDAMRVFLQCVDKIRTYQQLQAAVLHLLADNPRLFFLMQNAEPIAEDQLDTATMEEQVANFMDTTGQMYYSGERELSELLIHARQQSVPSEVPRGLEVLEDLVGLKQRCNDLKNALLTCYSDFGEEDAWDYVSYFLVKYPRPEGLRMDGELAYPRQDFLSEYREEGQTRWEEAPVANADWDTLYNEMTSLRPDRVNELRNLLDVIKAENPPRVIKEQHEASQIPAAEGQSAAAGAPASKEPPPLAEPSPVQEQSRDEEPSREELSREEEQLLGGSTIELTREQWLYENAAHARLYHSFNKDSDCNCWQFCQEVFLSPGFRVYIGLILYSTAAVTLIAMWQSVLDALTRLFLPREQGTWQSIGSFSVLVMFAFFVGAWVTQLAKTTRQWVLLTDDLYFCDKDYRDSGRTGEKLRSRIGESRWQAIREEAIHGRQSSPSRRRLPAALRPLLPTKDGRWAFTFFGLPTGGCMRREVYVLVLLVTTTILPVLYAGIRIATEDGDMYPMLGHFTAWILALGITSIAYIGLNARYLSVRLKYAAIKRLKYDGGQWNRNVRLLAEFGLDQVSVARNLAVLALCLLPLLVMWWLVSRNELQLSEEWIVLGLLICLLMLAVREAIRSTGTAAYAPYVAGSLWVIFVILGIAATAQVSGMAAVIFVVGTFLFGGVELRHGSWFSGSDSSGGVQPEGDPSLPQNPLAPTAERTVPPSPTVRSFAAALGYKLVKDEEAEPKQWLPCTRLFSAIFSCPCYGSCCSAPEEPSEAGWTPPAEEQDWRMDRHWYNDPSAFASSMNAPLMLWSLLSVVIAGGCALGVADELRQPVWKFSSEAVPKSSKGTYAVCKLRDERNLFTIVDYAMLADLSYTQDGNEWSAGFNSRFNGSGYEIVLPKGPSQRITEAIRSDFGEDGGGSALSWVHVYHHARRQHILVLRSNLEGRHLMRDLSVWGRSASAQLLSTLVPPVRLFTDQLMAGLVGGLGFLGLALDDGNHAVIDVTSPLTEFVQRLARNDTGLVRGTGNVTGGSVHGGSVVLVGHGTDGGFAAVVAAKLGLRSFTFGAPGTQWIRQNAGLPYPSPREIAVLSSSDPLAGVDKHTGGVQVIQCERDSIVECHSMREIACELSRRCGDPQQRGLACGSTPEES